MGRKYILAAVLSILASKASADPIFMSSHRKIDDVSATPFLESEGFINSFDAKFLKEGRAPKSIFLFNVNVNDKNSAAAIDELSSYSAIQNQFKPNENTYSTPYVKQASTKDFNRKLLNAIGNKNYIVSEVPLKDFSFENANELSKSGNKVLSVSHINTKDLPKLNNLLSNYQNTYAKNAEHDHVVVLKFTEDSTNAVQNLVDTRILAGDDAPAAGTPATGTPATGTPATGTPATGTPATGTPATGTPATGTPATGTPATGTPATGTPATGTPATGTPATGTPVTGKPVKQVTGGTTTGTSGTDVPIGIRGGGLAGIIIVIFLTIFVYIGFGVMQDIKTPAKFYKDTLQIGKEH